MTALTKSARRSRRAAKKARYKAKRNDSRSDLQLLRKYERQREMYAALSWYEEKKKFGGRNTTNDIHDYFATGTGICRYTNGTYYWESKWNY